MIYKKVVEGIFINRPNRFIANVIIGEKEEIVHVRNTGRCKEILVPGAKVILEDCSYNKNRKTKYSIIAVWKEDMLINMDSQIPNRVVYDALRENSISCLKNLSLIRREKTFRNSRFDMYFESNLERGFIEVKGVTLENDMVAMFPDAPTTRGTKHTLEIIDAVKDGYIGIIFFLIQMKGPDIFRLNWEMDREFSEAVALAYEKGVKILAYDSIVTEDSISIGNPIPIDMLPPLSD
ncbi:MAG: DNA/RNA nuclease SfsA [Clostridiales bacterium]|nr:DNA/RNA nuclease SfsA [Clostridiales bacterium]